MLLRDLINAIAKRPGMYGEDILQIRVFLTGFFLGAKLAATDDPWAEKFQSEFGDFVDAKFSNTRTAKSWAHLIFEQPGGSDLFGQIRIFVCLVNEFSGEITT